MRKEELYNLLIQNNIYSKVDAEKTKIFENDIVIEDDFLSKKFKIEKNGMTNADVIIALLAKQTLYVKTIKNIIVGSVVLAFVCFFFGFITVYFK